ncbi:aldo/keto reductase [uncultured Fusobacterium sp.]|uniref:aldo/keto reductase n=1 Tax=uncultured Fusobacterium sp. TaxID=159267 RepID=UPI0025FD524A|nr:aldo/keto reductase [uncultured Fusobacterium sp.]
MYKLMNGVEIPSIAFGTWKISDENICRKSVKYALECGYRHIDAARIYNNEIFVGKGISEFLKENPNIKREDLFITTKVWNSDQGYEETLKAFEASLERLNLDYIDLYLIHWPNTKNMATTFETWKALEKLYNDKKVRAIGVCNFEKHHLEELEQISTVTPMVNQVEIHPYNQQLELRKYCESKNIIVESWSPLIQGNVNDTLIVELAEKYKKSPAQIILKWHLQNWLLPLPKSITPSRIKENRELDFVLTKEDMEKINSLNKNERLGSHPDTMEYGFENLR